MQKPIRAQIFRLPCPLFPTDFLRLSCFLDLSVKNSGGQGANLSKDGANPPLRCALPRGSGQLAPRQQRAPARRSLACVRRAAGPSWGTDRASCVWSHECETRFQHGREVVSRFRSHEGNSPLRGVHNDADFRMNHGPKGQNAIFARSVENAGTEKVRQALWQKNEGLRPQVVWTASPRNRGKGLLTPRRVEPATLSQFL